MDYVYQAGHDSDGVLRTLSYQSTAGSVIYRRDIAKEVFGTDDPDTISQMYSTYDGIKDMAAKLKEKGYCILADAGSLHWFSDGKDAWVKDGALNMTADRLTYMDTAVSIYQNQEMAFAPEWSPAWYASMDGALPVNAGWSDLNEVAEDAETTQVFSYIMPSGAH